MRREEGKGKKRMEIGEIGGGGIFYVFFFFLDTTGIEILSILSSRALLYINIYTRIYSWLYNKWVCLYTYIYIFMYSDINTFVQRTTRHHQNPFQWLPRFQCGLPRWCRWSRSCDNLYNRIFLNHHALLINGLQGFPNFDIFCMSWHTLEVFPILTDWYLVLMVFDASHVFQCSRLFPIPKVLAKLARHIGKNSLMVPWPWNPKTWKETRYSETNKAKVTLTCVASKREKYPYC